MPDPRDVQEALRRLKVEIESPEAAEAVFGPEPKVGNGVYYCVGTDRHPATIIEISPSGKTITIQDDDYKRVDGRGLSEWQEYEFTPNPNGSTHTCRWNAKRKGWVTQGGRFYVSLTGRNAYRDPSK